MTAKRASRGKSTAITKASATAINLAQLERQIAVLVKTGDLEGLSDLHAKAQGVEAYFRARMPEREAGLQHQEHAARAVLLIERGLGDALAKRPKPDNLKKGKSRPSKKEARAKLLRELGITDKQSHRWQQLAAMPRKVFDARVKAIVEEGRRITTHAALKEPTSKKSGYEPDEYYTPKETIELVREVFGGEIELDPCSSLKAQEVVVAQRFYVEADKAETREWHGRVFMNPPYSDPAPFVATLLEALARGDVPEAIVLVNNTTDTAWAQSLLTASSAVCFTNGRISFQQIDAEDGVRKDVTNTRQGQMICYLGNDPDSFIAVFAECAFNAKKEPTKNAILRPSSPLYVPEQDETDEDEPEAKAAGNWYDEEQPEASA